MVGVASSTPATDGIAEQIRIALQG